MRTYRRPAPTFRPLAAILLLALALHASPARAQQGSGEEWRTWGSDAAFTRYSPLDQIAADNVGDLRVAWRWQTADSELQRSNPLWRAAREMTRCLYGTSLRRTIGQGS